jgi:hypothetical protein
MKQEMQIYRIKNGLGPHVNRQEYDKEPLLPTDSGSLRPIHPDEAIKKWYPGRYGDDNEPLLPLMDS